MNTQNDFVSIKRITELNADEITKFNTLLDVGTEWSVDQGIQFLFDQNNALFVAYIEHVPVGFATAHRLQRFDKRRAEILLYEIGVDEAFRQKGIAKALIEEIKKWGVSVGGDEMWVVTNTSNVAANALYKSTGGIRENLDDCLYSFKL